MRVKKFLAGFLSAMMVVSMLPTTAFAAGTSIPENEPANESVVPEHEHDFETNEPVLSDDGTKLIYTCAVEGCEETYEEDYVPDTPTVMSVDGLSDPGDGTNGGETTSYVAQIGEQKYETLQSAINEADNAETTISLLNDTTEAITISTNQNIILDLNGKTLTATPGYDAITVNGGKLTVKDSTAATSPFVDNEYKTVTYASGKVTASNCAISVYNGGNLIIESGIFESSKDCGIYIGTENGDNVTNGTATINGGYVSAQEYGIGVIGENSGLTINGGVIAAKDNAAVAGNGTTTPYMGGTIINITGGTLIGHIETNGYIACGVYHPQAGVLNITGGTIYADGGVGILMRGGNLNLTGGTVIATGEASGKVGDSKIINSCYGVLLDGNSNYYGISESSIIISGTAHVTADENIDAVASTEMPGSDSKDSVADKISITGGTFSSDVSDYVADDYTYDTSNGVVSNTNEASVIVSDGTTQKYTTLQEAVTNAASGDTVTLLKDISISNSLLIDKELTINGAGYTITDSTGELSPAIKVCTNQQVTINDLAVSGTKRGYDLLNAAAKLTLKGCTVNASERGITCSLAEKIYENVVLILDNTKINNSQVSDYETGAVYGTSYRGISLWNIKNSTVTLQNGSEINGFSYCINVSGDASDSGVADTNGLVVNVENSKLRGWTGLNIWGSEATYNITNSRILGVNTANGNSNNFSAIVFNDDIYDQFENIHAVNNSLNITDSIITNYQNGPCIETLLRIDCGITKLTLSGKVQFIDTTGNVDYALNLNNMDDPVSFIKKNIEIAEGATVTCTTLDNETLPIYPAYTVYYYWENGDGGYDGSYCDLKDIFAGTNFKLCSGEYIDLIDNVTLTEDVTAILSEGTGSFNLNFGEYSITGDGKIILPEGVSVVTDQENDALFAAVEGNAVSKTVSSDAEKTIYTYTSVIAAASVKTSDGNITYYNTLQNAIDAAEPGEIISLLTDADISTNGGLTFTKLRITFDLNGYTLKAANTASGNIKVFGGSLTLKDSSVTEKNGTGNGKIYTDTASSEEVTSVGVIQVGTTGKSPSFTMESGLIDTASSYAAPTNPAQNGITLFGNASKITISGGQIKSSGYAISGDISTGKNATLYVSGGEVISVSDYAIYHPHGGNLYIQGGIVYGKAGGINMTGGTLNVSGDNVITSKGQDNGIWGNGTGDADSPAINLGGNTVTASIRGGKIIATGNAITVSETSKITITGGEFSNQVPTDWCGTGYAPEDTMNTNGLYGIKELELVENSTTGRKYNSLKTAISDATDGQTITLLDDMILSSDCTISKSLVLDLNGKTLESARSNTIEVNKYNGAIDLTIKNGTIINNYAEKDPGSAIYVDGDVDLKLKDVKLNATEPKDGYGLRIYSYPSRVKNCLDVTVGGDSEISGSMAGIAILGNPAGTIIPKLTVEAGTITGDWYGIAGNGTNDNTSIVINGGTIQSLKTDGAAVYYPQNGDLTITNGTLSGDSGVQYLGTGKLIISGGSITATADGKGDVSVPSDDGVIPDGAALSIVSRGGGYGASGTAEVFITGGTFTSNNNVAIREYGAENVTTLVKSLQIGGDMLQVMSGTEKPALQLDKLTGENAKVITEGVFSSDVTEYCVTGKEAVPGKTEGTYVIDTAKYDVVLYSALKGGQTVSVADVTGGGSDIAYGTSVTVSAPAKTGYEFLGWYKVTNKTENEGTVISLDYDKSPLSKKLSYTFEADSNIELVALYKAVDKIKLTVNGSSFKVNGVEQNQTTYTNSFDAGTEITVESLDNKFYQWTNGSEKIVSTSASYTFVLVTDTILTANALKDTAEAGRALVEFVSYYGQVIQATTWTTDGTYELPTGPSKMGCTFEHWSMNGSEKATVQQIKDAISSGSTHITLKPVYDEPATHYTVTVQYPDNIKETHSDIPAGDGVTVTAKEIEGKIFSHWSDAENDGKILSYNSSYLMRVSGDITVYAIYVDENVDIEVRPTIVMSDSYASVVDGKTKISFSVTRSMPEGYTLVEQGVLYSSTNNNTETMQIGINGTNKYTSPNAVANGVTTLNITVTDPSKTIYTRGYMIVLNNATSNTETIYTDDVAYGSYNSLKTNE